MKYGLVTLFPELFSALDHGLIGRAKTDGKVDLAFANPRDFATDRHRTVDDTPYGGGSGMVLQAGPFVSAIEALDPDRQAMRVLLTPQGAPFRQATARRYVEHGSLVLVCGRYEGFDERIRAFVDEEVSLGDFVMLGGEVAALAIVEATARLIDGVIGNAESTVEESHAAGLLEYPQYTRPIEFRGLGVPDVLKSGNHAAIERWRRKESLRRTRARRPDLFDAMNINASDGKLLGELDDEPATTPMPAPRTGPES